MSEKKKSFQEFLANDALNPGVEDKKLQKVNVDKREVEAADDFGKECNAKKTVTPKIKKKPVGLFFLLGVVFLGLTIGLSFVSLWALWGIVPTLFCWWKMVLNNGDNNYKSVVDRYDSDYLERVGAKEKEEQRCQEQAEELENEKEKERDARFEKYMKGLEDEEKKEKQSKNNEKTDKKNKSRHEDDEDDKSNDYDDEDDEEEEEEEKEKNYKKQKAEKSNNRQFGHKVGNNINRGVENENSRTSLYNRNKEMNKQRTKY